MAHTPRQPRGAPPVPEASDGTSDAEQHLVKAGSIVSLHFNHPGTIAALPTILNGIHQRGLEPVTASTLLAIP